MDRTKRISARRTGNIQVESLEGRQLLVAGPTSQFSITAQNLLSRQRGFVLEQLAPPTPAVAASTSQISASAQNLLARQRGFELERLAPPRLAAGAQATTAGTQATTALMNAVRLLPAGPAATPPAVGSNAFGLRGVQPRIPFSR